MAGLMGSLYTGNTGLRASSIGVSVVGDNIANANTTGFKVGRAHFEDLISEYIVGSSGANQVGRGVVLSRTEKMFTQGSFANTGVPTDMAISGDGFFILSGTNSGRTQQMYTRNGGFRFDNEGFLVNQQGFRVQGNNADGTGQLSALQEDIRTTRTHLEPNPTTNVEIFANLRPDDPVTGPFDPNDPDNTSSFRTTIVAYDSLGNPHEVTVFGSRTADNTWEMNAAVDGGELVGGVAGDPQVLPLGVLTFNNQGQLQDENVPNPIAFDWLGAQAGAITFDFGDAINDGGTGSGGSSQWNRVTDSIANFISQDGFGTGELERIAIDDTGLITGGFTNGRTQVLGRVLLARFEDPTSLNVIGGNSFVESAQSGQPLIGDARGGGRGAIISSALELSNVELSDQFIDLIAYQRAFQANSKTIQTADGLLQEVFQILR